MKNSLIVVGVLAVQLLFTAKGAFASVKPYINEVRNIETELNAQSICSTRRLYAENILKSLNKPHLEERSYIASK